MVKTDGAAFFVDSIAAETDVVGFLGLETGTLGLVIGSLGVCSLRVEAGVGTLGMETGGGGSSGVETGGVAALRVGTGGVAALRVWTGGVDSLGVGTGRVKAAGERGVQRMIRLPVDVSLVVGDGGTRAAGFFGVG